MWVIQTDSFERDILYRSTEHCCHIFKFAAAPWGLLQTWTWCCEPLHHRKQYKCSDSQGLLLSSMTLQQVRSWPQRDPYLAYLSAFLYAIRSHNHPFELWDKGMSNQFSSLRLRLLPSDYNRIISYQVFCSTIIKITSNGCVLGYQWRKYRNKPNIKNGRESTLSQYNIIMVL